MQSERRVVAKRIDVSRPVELLDREGAEITTGFTRNLCEEGLRARVEDLDERQSANLLVRLYLEDGCEPVVKPACIVWSARDLYGEGAEVGLRLVDSLDEKGKQPETLARATPPAGNVLAEGKRVQIDAGGLVLSATVTAIEPPDGDGTLRVMMKVLGGEAAALDEFDPEEWKARPIRDAVAEVRRYTGPVVRCLAAFLALAARVLAPIARGAWARLPDGPRSRIERFTLGLARSRALLLTRRIFLSIACGARQSCSLALARFAVWKASRTALRTGD
jgi:hypothetical protein